MDAMEISAGLIEPGTRLRSLTESTVNRLMSSIRDVGLLHPVCVYRRKVIRGGIAVDGFGIVAGAHRVEACRRLGWGVIPAVITDADELHRQLAEVDENLCGTTLSQAEGALFTQRRKDIYEAMHPETRAGFAGALGKHGAVANLAIADKPDRFTADTAARTGQSERKVQRDAQRGESVDPEILEEIRGTDLDKGVVIDALAKAPRDEQRAKLAQIAAERSAGKTENKQIDRDIGDQAAAEFAEWLIARGALPVIPQIVTWLEATKTRDVIRELHRQSAGVSIMDAD